MIGYIRVSDKNKSDASSQKEAIKTYASSKNITITDWVEEFVSASKTELSERKLSQLINAGSSIIVSDITRLGRNNVLSLIGAIGSIAERGELHLAYDNRVINSDNKDDAETIFTVVGQSFASAMEAKKRSERAIAGHAKRKAEGLSSGRKVGASVTSKLDVHSAYVINQLEAKVSKAQILRDLEAKKGIKISRSRFFQWLSDRKM